MDLPHSDALRDAVDATWPPADVVTIPGWRLRVGAGGGKRVSSASAEGAPGDIAAAEAGMATLNQPPLFRLEGAEHDLDAALEARGYLLVDPVACLVGPTERLQPPHRDRVLYCDAPLATHLELWEGAGIGPARRAVMDRVRGAKSHLLGRSGDRPAGTGFVAVSGPIAFLHALEVAPWARRQGLGRDLTLGAALFARRAGASHLAVLVERANAPAAALYHGLGMVEAGGYHYRVHP